MGSTGDPQGRITVETGADGACTLFLDGVLDFDSVPHLVEGGKTLIAGHDQISVDMSRVSRSNSAGLALLLEWQRLARTRGASLQLRNVPQSLANLAGVCELTSVMPGMAGRPGGRSAG